MCLFATNTKGLNWIVDYQTNDGNAPLKIMDPKRMWGLYLPKTIRSELLRLFVDDRTGFANRCLAMAEKGSQDAAALLALMYLNKNIDATDTLECARYWASHSAESANIYGLYVLAQVELLEGHHGKARQMFAELAGDFGPAAWAGGKLFELGIGGARDILKAAALLELAKNSGHIRGAIDYNLVMQSGEFGLVRRGLAKLTMPIHHINYSLRSIFTSPFDSNKLIPIEFMKFVLNTVHQRSSNSLARRERQQH